MCVCARGICVCVCVCVCWAGASYGAHDRASGRVLLPAPAAGGSRRRQRKLPPAGHDPTSGGAPRPPGAGPGQRQQACH